MPGDNMNYYDALGVEEPSETQEAPDAEDVQDISGDEEIELDSQADEGQLQPVMTEEEVIASLNPPVKPELSKEIQSAIAQRDFAVDRSIRLSIESDIREIGRLDQSIRTYEDIKGSESYGKVLELVEKGNSLLDAYKLANFEKLTSSAASAQRQATLNSMQGKAHLRKMSGGMGELPVTVPAEIMREYRAIMPDLSDAEIQKHYNRYMKG